MQAKLVGSIVAVTAALLAGGGNVAYGDKESARLDPQATKIIERMSESLGRAKQFSVTADIAYDVVQDWGQKIEFGETRAVTVRRPDRLRVDTTNRDGSVGGLVFDGKQIAVFDAKEKVYATAEQPGSLDKAIAHFVNDLGMNLPLAALLNEKMAQDVEKWAREVRYVEASTIGGIACDHIALHGDWEDVQLWIARGDRPLPQRVVITYTRAEASPQFSAQLRDWNLESVPDSAFTFTPPEGAAKIAFAPTPSSFLAAPAGQDRP